MRNLIQGLLLALAPSLSLAQFPPTPSGLITVKSKVDPAVTISYKEAQICKQPSGVKTYSGFVHLPASILALDYYISTYFLYFEARQNPSTAPLALYFAGGAGESSTYTALASESGPCYVNYDGTDTINNLWSFNERVNMLYIDQPVQTGFSYDKLVNATYDLISELITPLDLKKSALPHVNASFGYGVFPSQEFKQTANLTVQAAKALWHFGEHWLSSFPSYDTQSKHISIWGNSYGGYWVPETAAQFSKNLKALPRGHPLKPKCLTIDTVGITNGCIDFETGASGWPTWAFNNTYGVRFASKAQYESAMHNLTKPGGGLDLIKECRALGEASDPDFSGSNATVNKVCEEALDYTVVNLVGGFPKLNKRDAFDTATIGNPCPWWLPVNTYLNTASIQEELGVPLNFTYDSDVVTSTFGLPSPYTNRPLSKMTGDGARQNGLPDIEYLLANDVKVAFIYGDRDYRCPWTGGEATALAAKWDHQDGFQAAGYEELQGTTKKGTDHGAVVKQYERFSFSRVFDAGHAVSAYAPETVYRIFERTVLGLDAVTGKEKIGPGYTTTGPATSWQWRNEYPSSPPETCILQGRFTEKNPWTAIVPS